MILTRQSMSFCYKNDEVVKRKNRKEHLLTDKL